MTSYRRTIFVEFEGGKAAKRLRKAGAKIELGMGTVTRAVTSRAVRDTRQAAEAMGGVQEHILPGILIKGGNNVRLDFRNHPAIFGAVFGGGARPTTQQFDPWLGQDAYILFPELRGQEAMMDRIVTELIDRAL